MVTHERTHEPVTVERAPDALRVLRDLPREHGFEPLKVEGTLPADLEGTIYRNGASLFSAGGRRYAHLFDGDGGLCAVRFSGGAARGAARIVESAGLREERAAGRLLYGGYGTIQPGFLARLRFKVKNTANTSVLWWNGRLYALMEACRPTEIDPDELTTLGESDLGGAVARSFSAHPHFVPARQATYNFGVRYGRNTEVDLYELPVAGPARCLGTVRLPGPTMIHDFIATERHLVFFAPPLRLRVLRVLLGRAGYGESLAWRPELGTEVIVVPIDDPSRPVRFEVEPFYQWHFANAFERGQEIVVDFCRYPDFESNRWLAELHRGLPASERLPVDGSLHRAVLEPSRRRFRCEEVYSAPADFPRVAPAVEARPYRFCYLAAHSERSDALAQADAIARVDLESGEVRRLVLERGRSTWEPVFVPRQEPRSEDDGYLLALVYDAPTDTSHCAVFDARDLEAGPLARAHFDHHIPPRFHGIWVPARSRS